MLAEADGAHSTVRSLGAITGGGRGSAGHVGRAALPPLVAQIGGSGRLDAGVQLRQLGAGAGALRQGAQEEWKKGVVRSMGRRSEPANQHPNPLRTHQAMSGTAVAAAILQTSPAAAAAAAQGPQAPLCKPAQLPAARPAHPQQAEGLHRDGIATKELWHGAAAARS